MSLPSGMAPEKVTVRGIFLGVPVQCCCRCGPLKPGLIYNIEIQRIPKLPEREAARLGVDASLEVADAASAEMRARRAPPASERLLSLGDEEGLRTRRLLLQPCRPRAIVKSRHASHNDSTDRGIRQAYR